MITNIIKEEYNKLSDKEKIYYWACDIFLTHQEFYQHVKNIVDTIKEKGYDIPGDFIGVGSINLIKEKWQEGCLPVIMNDINIYIKFLPFELFCGRMSPEEYIKANKHWANKKFKETNQELIKGLQEKIDNNDPNIDIEQAKKTIEYIKSLKYDD